MCLFFPNNAFSLFRFFSQVMQTQEIQASKPLRRFLDSFIIKKHSQYFEHLIFVFFFLEELCRN